MHPNTQERFLSYIKMFNAKERFFVARYAFCEESDSVVSDRFKRNLMDRLCRCGYLDSGESAEVLFVGIDYHLEWLEASLLLVNEVADEQGNIGEKALHKGVEARSEDADLIILIGRKSGEILLILVEAKGIGSVDMNQLGSKIKRLKRLRKAIPPHSKWLVPVFFYMTPNTPRKETMEKIKSTLTGDQVGFWKEDIDAELIKLPFPEFPNAKNLLRVEACDQNGSPPGKDKVNHTHWRILSR